MSTSASSSTAMGKSKQTSQQTHQHRQPQQQQQQQQQPQKPSSKAPHPSSQLPQQQQSSHRATPNSATIGADLLTQPAPISKDLTHLVGRQLVPFFTSSGEENATHALHHNEQRDFGVAEDHRGQQQVRAFVDGYFVEQGSLAGQNTSQQQQPSSYANALQQKPAAKGSSKQQQPQPRQQSNPSPPSPALQPSSQPTSAKKSGKKGTTNTNNQPTPPSGPAQATSTPSKFYAGAAFLASPSPLQVPLPKFLSNKTAESSQAKQTSPQQQSNANPPHHHAGHSTDAHASQSLMAMLRGGGSHANANTAVAPPPAHQQMAQHPHHAQPTLLAPHHSIPTLPPPHQQHLQQPQQFYAAPGGPPTPHPHHAPPQQMHHQQQPQHQHMQHQHHAPPQHPHAPPPHHPQLAHAHSAPYPVATSAQPSYYAAQPIASGSSSSTSSSAAAVPLPSAVYSRYDRPQFGASMYGQPQPVAFVAPYQHPSHQHAQQLAYPPPHQQSIAH